MLSVASDARERLAGPTGLPCCVHVYGMMRARSYCLRLGVALCAAWVVESSILFLLVLVACTHHVRRRDGNGLAAAAHNTVSNNAKELLKALGSITTAVNGKRTGSSGGGDASKLSEECCKLTSSKLKVRA